MCESVLGMAEGARKGGRCVEEVEGLYREAASLADQSDNFTIAVCLFLFELHILCAAY